MARPLKDGLDYFPLDTDWRSDHKVRLLRGEYGEKGLTILCALWALIYKDKGYYMPWDDDMCGILADELGSGYSPSLIREVVEGCVKRSLFDKRVLDAFRVLTSRGVQRRYVRAASTRKQIRLVREYLLIDLSDCEDIPAKILCKTTVLPVSDIDNPVNIQRNPVDLVGSTQSKVKESKVKESESSKGAETPPTTTENSLESLCTLITDLVKPVTSSDRVMVGRWLVKMDPACIRYAIREASRAPQPSTGYVVSVLNALERDGVHTADQLAERNAKRTGRSSHEIPGVHFAGEGAALNNDDLYYNFDE